MPSLDSITFDSTGLTFQGDQEGARFWLTPAGDGIGLYYFPIPPDIEADVESVRAIRDFYRGLMARSGAAIIEVDVLQVDGCLAVRQIIKTLQEPHGMTYLGSFTLPFRDFSYVVKIQCMEQGITGRRDAAVLNEKVAAGEVTARNGTVRGWMQDPYDDSIRDVFARNLSEAEEYDERFPNHPLSRLRVLLRRVQESLRIGNDVRGKPRFVYADRQEANEPWWKVW